MRKQFEILREEAGDGGDGGGGGDAEFTPPEGKKSIFGDDDGGKPPAGDPPANSEPDVTDTRQKPDPSTTAKPYFDGLYDTTGKIDKTKLDSLPDHLKKHSELFKRYDTIDGVLGAFANFSSLAGRKGDLSAYERPGDDASDKAKEDHIAFLKTANNVPDDIAGYGIEKPEGMDQKEWDESPMNGYLEAFHKHNASPELVKEMVSINQGLAEAAEKQAADAWTNYAKAEMNSLRTEFKTELPEVRALAERAASRFGLDDSALGSAAAVKAFYQIGKALGEDNLPSGKADAHGGITDRQRAQAILNDKSDPLYKAYHDPNHPDHAETVKFRSSLNAKWAASQAS